MLFSRGNFYRAKAREQQSAAVACVRLRSSFGHGWVPAAPSTHTQEGKDGRHQHRHQQHRSTRAPKCRCTNQSSPLPLPARTCHQIREDRVSLRSQYFSLHFSWFRNKSAGRTRFSRTEKSNLKQEQQNPLVKFIFFHRNIPHYCDFRGEKRWVAVQGKFQNEDKLNALWYKQQPVKAHEVILKVSLK